MADENPTGRGAVVSLTILAADAGFLRGLFTMALEGIRSELDEYPESLQALRQPTHLQREEEIYKALLAALDGEPIFPDQDIHRLLCDLMAMNDRENEHARAVAEHKALANLIGQLTGSGAAR
jgi:hypothetical protein